MEEKSTTRGALLCKLFFTMMKIGLFTFGGGYAMLALFEAEFVDKKKWIGKTEFMDMLAIAESTPGPLAINGATYVGYKIAGFLGALVSTVAVCIPSFAIIYAISLFFDRFLSLTFVAYAFAGIRVCVCVLIFNAVVKLFKGSVKDWAAGLIFLAVLAAALLTDLSPVIFVAAAAALGIVIQNVIRRAK